MLERFFLDLKWPSVADQSLRSHPCAVELTTYSMKWLRYTLYETKEVEVNPFTTGNPFLGTKLLGFSIGRGLGALKGSSVPVVIL